MMVYGHQSSATEGAYFAQKPIVHDPRGYLATARRLPDEVAMSQPPPLLHQQPQLPQLIPTPNMLQQQQQQQQRQQPQQQQLLHPPPLLKFQGVCEESGCSNSCDGNDCSDGDCDMAAEDGSCCVGENETAAAGSSNGSGFLYSLLTAQDATAVQQCSAFLGGTVEQFPRRSQSVSVPARRGSAVLPSATLQPFASALGCCRPPLAVSRPSSAPRGLRGPYGGGSAPALTGVEEPLDLSGQQQQQQQHLRPESIIEQQLILQQRELELQRQHQHQLQQLQHLQQLQQQQQQQQPMLRTMLLCNQMPQLPPQQPLTSYEQSEQPVRLAKKTVLVAQSHVADWLKKGADLVRTNGALFGALDKAGRADLLCRAWPRLLQLYMLENNFQFAVSPAASASGDSVGETTTAKRQPTRQFADELQRLIAAASGLPFDNVTYNLMRLAAIFTPDATKPDAPALAEVQSEIVKHIYHHLNVKGLAQQHFKDAEALLEVVSLTDKTRLEILFCSHLSSTVDEYIRNQLRAV